MNKLMKIAMMMALPVVAGCLTSSAPEIACWKVENLSEAKRPELPNKGVLRIAQVDVRAPYDVRSFCVERDDGTLAFDGYNEFAAVPSQLLRGAVHDAFWNSGKFSAVVGAASAVRANLNAETVFSTLALDCRKDGVREAEVAVLVRLIDAERRIVACEVGKGRANAADGNYAAAFSKAVTLALEDAISKIK